MFSTNHESLLKKRVGILGQFSKAINDLMSNNDQIDNTQSSCKERIHSLHSQMSEEELELSSLKTLKAANEKTIKKMQEFMV